MSPEPPPGEGALQDRAYRYLDDRLREVAEQLVGLRVRMDAAQTALVVAAEALNRRLDVMNELRDQINRERGAYVAVSTFQAEMRAHEVALDAFQQRTEERLNLIDSAQANVAGRFWAFSLVPSFIAIAAFFLSLLSYFYGKR